MRGRVRQFTYTSALPPSRSGLLRPQMRRYELTVIYVINYAHQNSNPREPLALNLRYYIKLHAPASSPKCLSDGEGGKIQLMFSQVSDME